MDRNWVLKMKYKYDRDPYQSIQSWIHHNALPHETVEQLTRRYIKKYKNTKDFIKKEDRKEVVEQVRSIIAYVVGKRS